jgi:hypothetical protein
MGSSLRLCRSLHMLHLVYEGRTDGWKWRVTVQRSAQRLLVASIKTDAAGQVSFPLSRENPPKCGLRCRDTSTH